MTIRTVTYDDATHVVVPRNPTDEMCARMLVTSGNFNKYCAAITEAPPFTSLPNPDLDQVEKALMLSFTYFSKCHMYKRGLAALKRLKGE